MLPLSPIDFLALAWFIVAWVGFTLFADRSRWSQRNVASVMNRMRRRWLREMFHRELRMVDMQIQQIAQHGIAFFASTSILVLGGLIAGLGATDTAATLLAGLPFAAPTTAAVWEVKILLMIAIFVYAFFKFARAFRLTTYFVILIGATPPLSGGSGEAQEKYVERIARVGDYTAEHIAYGLRAYFFALAGLGWLIHPILFLLTTTWVLAVLYRREFRSRALTQILEADEALTATPSTPAKSPDTPRA